MDINDFEQAVDCLDWIKFKIGKDVKLNDSDILDFSVRSAKKETTIRLLDYRDIICTAETLQYIIKHRYNNWALDVFKRILTHPVKD